MPLLSGDVLLVLAGVLMVNGSISPWAFFPTAFVAEVAGVMTGHFWTRTLGQRGLEALADKGASEKGARSHYGSASASTWPSISRSSSTSYPVRTTTPRISACSTSPAPCHFRSLPRSRRPSWRSAVADTASCTPSPGLRGHGSSRNLARERGPMSIRLLQQKCRPLHIGAGGG